jgi:hypothetical protein
MQTNEFLRLILPERGFKILAELAPHPKSGALLWRHKLYSDADEMAEAALALDRAGRTVYHACNGYGDWFRDEANRRKVRTQDNVVACRSLYDDIDAGKPGAYPTRREAAVAIKGFVEQTGLPAPVIVSSGRGFHLYWPFARDIDPADWQRLAVKKRALTDALGLLSDPAADRDSARVLRPVGTTWRKGGQERPVALLHPGRVMDAAEFEALLDAALARHGVEPEAPRPAWMEGGGNIEAALPAFPESSLALAAERCPQLACFKATGGETEPFWHACAGIARHAIDGEALWHEWSARYPRYARSEAAEKLANWRAGPTTCESFAALAPHCEGCAWKGKITSPIQLGVAETETAPPPSVPVETGEDEPQKFEEIPYWPEGYSFDAESDTIFTRAKDENGVVRRVRVAMPLFYFTETVRREDGASVMLGEARVRGDLRRFELETKFVADPRSLRVQLAAQRIITMNANAIQDYTQKYLAAIMKGADEATVYQQFGWKHDYESFLIGTKLIQRDANSAARLSRAIPEKLRAAGETSGDPATWASLIDDLYGREHAEPYQFVIGLAFGGILGPFLPSTQWRGIPLALTSETSGLGKSAVCQIALNIYAPQHAAMVTDITVKGVLARASVMGNVPFLLDEVTGYLKKPEDMATVLYALSNGEPRVGLTREGSERSIRPGWNLPALLTGNRNILQQLTHGDVAPEATQMRVFEIDLDDYPRIETLDPKTDAFRDCHVRHQRIVNELIGKHYGAVGEKWIRWVIQNRRSVVARLAQLRAAFQARAEGGDASKERFYYDLATLAIAGLHFGRHLGLLDFDVKKVVRWAIDHIARMRVRIADTRNDPQDLLALMLADMNGQLLITNRYRGCDSRTANRIEHDQGGVRGSVVGRVVRGDGEPARVFVSVRAANDWCTKNRINAARFKNDLMLAGRLVPTALEHRDIDPPGVVRVSLGRGVQGFEHIGQVRCLDIRADSRTLASVPPPEMGTEPAHNTGTKPAGASGEPARMW